MANLNFLNIPDYLYPILSWLDGGDVNFGFLRKRGVDLLGLVHGHCSLSGLPSSRNNGGRYA